MDIAINYWAVIACGVSAMVLGFLWYGPIFGKQWKALMGYTDESMKAMKMKPNTAYALMAVAALIEAYVLAHMLGISEKAWGMMDLSLALQGGFWLWLGFVATTQIGAVLWENKSWKLFFLNAAYSLISVEIMATILALWK